MVIRDRVDRFREPGVNLGGARERSDFPRHSKVNNTIRREG